MPGLFTPLTIRTTTFANRAWVSPMCMYSAIEGEVQDWHLVHLGALAAGGAGLVMAEATGVLPEARISTHCPGIWTTDQTAAWARIVRFAHGQGTAIGLQLAHAGRKASTSPPWTGGSPVAPDDGGWETVGPSAVAFGAMPAPREMSADDLDRTIHGFREAAARAVWAGFDVVEVHAAHGYLLHQFLSPLSNHRTDEYGGSLENRMRFPLAVIAAVREVAADKPLFVRISMTDWMVGGWDLDSSVEFAGRLKDLGVDLIDASSGGLHPDQAIPDRVDYQTELAAQLRQRVGMPVAAVGRITEARQAEQLIASDEVDAVFLARQMLRDPHWPLRAAHELGVDVAWPPQYLRAASWQS